MFALSVGIIGTAGSLIGAWYISMGPAVDRAALPCFLFGSPAVFVSLGLTIIFLRNWLRSRIRPNRFFPLPPRLPPGSPPALIANEQSGVLEAVKPRNLEDSGWCDFQIGRDCFPPLCCSCLGRPAGKHSYTRPIAPGVTIEIPCCANCARWSTRDWWRVWWVTVEIPPLIGLVVPLVQQLDSVDFWVLFGESGHFPGTGILLCGRGNRTGESPHQKRLARNRQAALSQPGIPSISHAGGWHRAS